jgi:hypothetical protein
MGPVGNLLGNLEVPLDNRAADTVTHLVAALGTRSNADGRGLIACLVSIESLVQKLNLIQSSSVQPIPYLTVRVYDASWGICVLLIHRGIPLFEAFTPEIGDSFVFLSRQQEVGSKEFAFLLPSKEIESDCKTSTTTWDQLGLENAALIAGTGPTYEPVGAITIEPTGPESAVAISRLFYHVYGFSYVNSDVYDPNWLRSRMESGDLRSYIARDTQGVLLGHVGLLRHGKGKDIFEPCMGITDPRVKSRGLFSSIFNFVMEQAEQIPMRMCVFDCVTNIDFSQRLIVKHAGVETALLVGCQTKSTQARLAHLGLGPDPEAMERYSLLMLVKAPPGHSAFQGPVRLPASMGSPLDAILGALQLDWEPTSRCDVLSAGGSFELSRDARQASFHFNLDLPGRDALHSVIERKRDLFRDGDRYCSVDLPADARGLGAAHDILAGHGFFLAGLVPYRMTARLGIRLQALAPTQVGFPQIKVYSPLAQQLLTIVRKDYERQEEVQ